MADTIANLQATLEELSNEELKVVLQFCEFLKQQAETPKED